MYYVSVQPDQLYFIWQLQVQINNFRKLGIEDKMIIILGYDKIIGKLPESIKLAETTKAKIIFYEDDRTEDLKEYIPSIRPYLLKRFVIENIDMFYGKSWMYHDCDILFREIPKFKNINKLNKIYVSDTRSYLDSNYLKSKSPILFKEMCKIVGIDTNIVEENNSNCGGAQYVFGGNAIACAGFWDKVTKDSVSLYRYMNETKLDFSPEHPVQSWTADMWAIIWNLWLMGYKTEISNNLSFSWPVHTINDWENHKIFHNAGVTNSDKHLFFKGDFINKTPFNENFEDVNKDYCSYKYVEEIVDTKKSINHFS